MSVITPLVTISIPLYKCEDFLEKCLDSVRMQTYENLEVTLINDQTPDNSVQIAEDYIARHQLSNWKIYHLETNSGLSVVRNKGIDTAEGKYLFFLDSDDTITPDCIEFMVQLAEDEELEMVVGNAETISLETGKTSETFKIRATEKFVKGNDDVFQHFIKGLYPTTSWNKLIRIDFLKSHQLYFTPGLFSQDELQSFQTALHLNSLGFVHKSTYHYYLHKNSVIHNRTRRNFDNWFTIGQYVDKALKKEKNEVRRRQILQYLTNYKSSTLQMNWKAQKDEALWKESYRNYLTLSSLGWKDYFSGAFDKETLKKDFLNSLPVGLGFRIFKWRYER